MRFRLTRFVVLVALGCSRPAPESPTAPTQLAPARVSVITVLPDGSTKDAAEEIVPQQLLGSYYVGDGTGYNLGLDLKDGQKFACTWTGCLGVYGTSSGRWSVESEGLKLVTENAEGMLKDPPLGRLRVISLQGHYLLLQERDQGWFAEHGPNKYCCFHQKTARKSLNEEWLRRIERASKKLGAGPN